MAHPSLQRAPAGRDIMLAVTMAGDRERVEALRRIAGRLHDGGRDSAASVRDEVLAVLHQQSMARAYQTLRELSFAEPIDELHVMRFAAEGQRELAACAIANLAHLPVHIAERLFAACSADMLLVVCRAQNFAWSTLRLLLSLRADPLTDAEEQALCDDYHDMPLALAQRFGRYLRAHFEMESWQ